MAEALVESLTAPERKLDSRLVVALHGLDASSPVSPADFADYRRESRSFDGLAAAQAWAVTLGMVMKALALPMRRTGPTVAA